MPTPAEEILAKAILPTGLSSAELRDTIAPEIRRRSFFSARTAEAEYLVKARQVCADVAAGKIGQSEARFQLEGFLDSVGWPAPGNDSGDITDLGSIARLDLIIDTQRDMAHSVARIDAQTPDMIDQFPAWRFVRFGTRKDPRNWEERWAQAASAVGWEGVARNGEMVALKTSPIWEALGAGAGDHRDTLGNPYPPFAFNSGMDWRDVSAEECERIGLVPKAGKVPRESLTPGEKDFKRVAEKIGRAQMDEIERAMEAFVREG